MKEPPVNSCILNDNRYNVQFTLGNTKTRLDLPLGLVKQFILYDNMYSIFQTGKLIIDNAKPNGLDISRSIKDEKNNISDEKLKKFLQSFSA